MSGGALDLLESLRQGSQTTRARRLIVSRRRTMTSSPPTDAPPSVALSLQAPRPGSARVPRTAGAAAERARGRKRRRATARDRQMLTDKSPPERAATSRRAAATRPDPRPRRTTTPHIHAPRSHRTDWNSRGLRDPVHGGCVSEMAYHI